MSEKPIALTDVSKGIWLDEFTLDSAKGPALEGAAKWSVSKRTLRGGLSAGVDVVEIHNGAFSIFVLPTRGMGIWKGEYRGIPVGWKSPVAFPVNPAYVDLNDRSGLGWLKGFNEFICRCGLSSNGAPGMDVAIDNNGNKMETPLTLHGKIANAAAHRVEVMVSDKGAGTLSVSGEVDETMLFGPCLRLSSTVQTEAGSNRFTILDRVTNLSGMTAEFELLYHTNLGRPFLEKGSEFLAPVKEVAPTNDRAAEDIDTWPVFEGPVAGYVEQCYFYELLGSEAGETLVLLKNAAGDKGISLHFNRRQLPWFTIWKNTQAEADGYVTGLEPGTDFPNAKSFERSQGRVVELPAGASYETRLDVAIHDSKGAVSEIEKQIKSLSGSHQPIVHRAPIAKFSPIG